MSFKKSQTEFELDNIFTEAATQVQIFTSFVLPSLQKFYKGFNTLTMAYGETGSGKTYTMLGGDKIKRKVRRKRCHSKIDRTTFHRQKK